jgi:flagellar FliL protein
MSEHKRPERIAANMSKSSSSPGATTGGSGDEKQTGKGKKSKVKLIAIVLVLLLAGGAVAKFTVLAPPAKASAEAVKKKPAKGPVIAMDDMTLNLANGAYLRLKISLQTAKGTSEELDTAAAAQDIIDTFSNLTTAQLTGSPNRKKYQDLLLKKLQEDYPKQILDVPYQEFVMTGS